MVLIQGKKKKKKTKTENLNKTKLQDKRAFGRISGNDSLQGLFPGFQ